MNTLTKDQIKETVEKANNTLNAFQAIVSAANASQDLRDMFDYTFTIGGTSPKVTDNQEIIKSALSKAWDLTRLSSTGFLGKTLGYANDKINLIKLGPITVSAAEEVVRLARNELTVDETREILTIFLSYINADQFGTKAIKVQKSSDSNQLISDLMAVIHETVLGTKPTLNEVKQINDKVIYLNGFQNKIAQFEAVDIEMTISADQNHKSFKLSKETVERLNNMLVG